MASAKALGKEHVFEEQPKGQYGWKAVKEKGRVSFCRPGKPVMTLALTQSEMCSTWRVLNSGGDKIRFMVQEDHWVLSE